MRPAGHRTIIARKALANGRPLFASRRGKRGEMHYEWRKGNLRRNNHAEQDEVDVRGVILNALTTNGSVHCRDLNSVVKAATTNGNVEVSTSEWASAITTNGGVRVAMGSAKWNGELELKTTNGSVNVTLPSSAEFTV